MRLSLRLEKILSLVDSAGLLVDIGTDHALIPIEALRRGKVREAVAGDISLDAIERARERVEAAGLSDSIRLIVSDGFEDIPCEPIDTLIISGMGARLICRILTGLGERKVRYLILSPQSEPEMLRHFLIDKMRAGIVSESYVCEHGTYYTLIRADCLLPPEAYSENEYLYGKCIDPETLETYTEYLRLQLSLRDRALKDIREGRYETR